MKNFASCNFLSISFKKSRQCGMCRYGNHLYLVLIVLFVVTGRVYAQSGVKETLADNISSKMELYGLKMDRPILFVHFDKNVYSNNENVWFTAYVLNLARQLDYKVLCVTLVRDDDHKPFINDKFMINNGFAFGNTIIPDSASAGNYSFIAYGNRLRDGRPDVLFTQKITIKTNAQTGYHASLNPLDTSVNNGQQKVMLLVTNNDAKKNLSKLSASYYVGIANRPVQKGEVKVSPEGQYIFNIPSAALKQGENRLHVRLNRGNETKDLSIDLPARQQPAVVHFFPEGGNLVAGLNNKVAWEAKSAIGQAMAVAAVLYENKKAIDTIRTNGYGFGKFMLTPKAGAGYSVKLKTTNTTDTLYSLPLPVNNIPAMSVQTAIVNNELSVGLTTLQPQQVYLNVHNYGQLYSSTVVKLGQGDKKLRIILDDIPRGLAQITLTDSLGRPLAERTFFAHYDKRPTLIIKTDKAVYKSREKVTLSFKLSNKGIADSGLVSIACVQENRLKISNKNDIDSYFYLTDKLGRLPVKEHYLGTEDADRAFLEDILLIKGWRRYTWLDMLKTTSADTVIKAGDLIFKGAVMIGNTRIKKAVDVLNINNPIKAITTDSSGNFTVAESDLIVQRNKKLRLLVNNDKNELYRVKLIDPYLLMTDSVTNELEFTDRSIAPLPNTQLLEMKGFERAIALKEVKIKGRNDNQFRGFGSNECGDYVCRYHILNCPNHRNETDNTQPIVGNYYTIENKKAMYKGCLSELERKGVVFNGIYAAQEFYPSDLSQPDAPPEYQSTIYWQYLSLVKSETETVVSFYTNDITGPFKIVVQGHTDRDVVYGEGAFEVKGK